MRILISFLLIAGMTAATAQPCLQLTESQRHQAKSDVWFLANDFLEGREAGTRGEQIAADYLSFAFEALGLTPLFAGEDGPTYRQPFTVYLPVQVEASTALSIDGQAMTLNRDFYPLNLSANGELSGVELVDVGFGIEAPELEYSDYGSDTDHTGKAFLINYSSPDGVHPHSKYAAYHDLATRIELAEKKGAVAVLVYNTTDYLDDPARSFNRLKAASIPVIFVHRRHLELLQSAPTIDALSVAMQENARSAHNVAALLDRGAEKTIVIGAHYDHLGYGDEGSRYRGDERLVHNGADDNASGTAGLLALARYYAAKPEATRHNLLFLAFSAEEKGLLGSKHFVEASPVATEDMLCMLNMDMIGRLDQDQSLVVNGTGTSPLWDKAMAAIDCYDLNIQANPSGVGPSDHTSFYLKDVPDMAFFTGAHQDYHHPADDAHKVNYGGMYEVIGYVGSLVQWLSDQPELPFSETKQEDNENRPRFSVTLGVMPDYAFGGEGMRIDAVTEGKPAANAGIQASDVVVKMGQFPITGMQSYMRSLGQFKPGDETTVLIEREGEEMALTVTF